MQTEELALGRQIGVGTHPTSSGPVGIGVRDGLRHTWLLGPTGVGKSTVLEHLARADVAAGRGVVMIDPKGDLVENMLATLDESALARVRVLDSSRLDFVVGFNPLVVDSAGVELAVDGVLHVLRSLNRDSWGPRTQDILHASLLTLARSARPTLVLIPELLTDPVFRRKITAATTGALRGFWGWYEALSAAERSSVIAPVLNKIRPFTMRSSLRAMLGQTERAYVLDLSSVFRERAIVLVPLRRGLIGSEAANLIGALVLSGLWQAAQAQAGIPADRRPAAFAYLDEFQDYLALPTSLSEVLAQSRGLGLGLVLAHQHLGQLSPDIRSSVMANAQNQLMFRLGADDANVIARSTDNLEAADFRSLPAFAAYARLLVGGEQHDFGSLRTLPPPAARRDAGQIAKFLAERDGRDANDLLNLDRMHGRFGSDLEHGDVIGERPRQPPDRPGDEAGGER